MAYTSINFKSKAALKRALAEGQTIRCYQPGGIFPLEPGSITLEGPHYPEPHKWYASCKVDSKLNIIPGTLK